MTDERVQAIPLAPLPDSERQPRRVAREIDVERWKRNLRTLKKSNWTLDSWTSCFLGLLGGAVFSLVTVDHLSRTDEVALWSASLGLGFASLASYFRHKNATAEINRTVDEICCDIDEVVRVTTGDSRS